ncbi:SRPBCC domain-containing protein [bacterium]|nr:SRPBCC domain-containing protein [bacterium]
MKTRSHEHRIEIAASPERVWEGIADAKLLSQWILSRAEVDGRVDGHIKMDWGDEGVSEARIEKWDPPRSLQVQHLPWEGCPPLPDSGGPRDTYSLEVSDGGTSLHLLCSNMSDDSAWDEFFEGTKQGWPHFLSKLKELLENS